MRFKVLILCSDNGFFYIFRDGVTLNWDAEQIIVHFCNQAAISIGKLRNTRDIIHLLDQLFLLGHFNLTEKTSCIAYPNPSTDYATEEDKHKSHIHQKFKSPQENSKNITDRPAIVATNDLLAPFWKMYFFDKLLGFSPELF